MRGRHPLMLVLAAWLSGCASLPPELQPKPYSLTYARQTLLVLKRTWILTNPESVRDAKVGRFEALLAGQSSLCVAYDSLDRSGAYTGLKPHIVFISTDHATITQVIDPNGSYPCSVAELQPFPELNGPAAAAAAKPAPGVKPPPRGLKHR